MRCRLGSVAVAVVVAALVGGVSAHADPSEPGSGRGWFAAWSRPQAITLVGAAEATSGSRGQRALVDQTLRVITRVTAGGDALRIHLANRYGTTPFADGTTPLVVEAATVALRAPGGAVTADVLPDTLRTVTFAGAAGTTLAPGTRTVSDPIPLRVHAGDDVAVSLHVASSPAPPEQIGALVTSFASSPLSGDHTGDAEGTAFTERTTASPLVTAVDVASGSLNGVVAATGGSVTQGTGSETDGHNDFPSALSLRIRDELPEGQQHAVVNHGIGGTTAAAACSVPAFGPSVEERFADDTLGLDGLTHVIVYAGTNDLGFGCSADQIIGAYRSILRQAQERGVKVLITTITPRAAYTQAQNAERAAVNSWVRAGGNCSGECHHGLDFDAVVRDPANPNRLNPDHDSGDGIHPNALGYRLIAASIPLSALR